MVARWYIADVNGTFSEITGRVAREGWEVHEQAEEGSGGMVAVTFNDPDMDYDPEPWRNWYVLEDTSEDANSMLCGGWTTEQEVGREVGEVENPLGRAWSVSLTDANAYWQMRVMVGSDANRPAETDVQRVQWLLATNEMAWALNVTTYVQTTTPVAMDACDYRGQMVNQIMDDAAQASGRNWYTWIDMIAAVRTVTVWYGHDDWAIRDSPLSLSNEPTDWTDAALADGTSLVWPISYDTKLKRDPSRMYDGCYLTYSGGAVYRDTTPRTVRRDFISPSYNVKSKTKAIARAVRYLGELGEQDEVITTTVELPAAKATMIRAGMRLRFRAAHLPGFDGDAIWCRVLSCSVTPGAAGERYRLSLELSPGAAVTPCDIEDFPLTEAGTYEGNHSNITQAPGNLFYWRPGVLAPEVPTIGHVGAWHFPDYANDRAGDCVANVVRVVVAGGGTLTVTLADYLTTHTFYARLAWDAAHIHQEWSDLPTGALTFTIPDDEHCIHWVDIESDGGSGCEGKWQFVSWQWVPA